MDSLDFIRLQHFFLHFRLLAATTLPLDTPKQQIKTKGEQHPITAPSQPDFVGVPFAFNLIQIG